MAAGLCKPDREPDDLLRDQSKLFFVLCGEGAARAHLQALAREKGLMNVKFLPLQPADRLAGMLSAAMFIWSCRGRMQPIW